MMVWLKEKEQNCYRKNLSLGKRAAINLSSCLPQSTHREMPQLLNTLASPEQIALTPSRQDGIPEDLEDELRVYGCQLIQQAGILLDL
jgi:hypothetical protein